MNSNIFLTRKCVPVRLVLFERQRVEEESPYGKLSREA